MKQITFCGKKLDAGDDVVAWFLLEPSHELVDIVKSTLKQGRVKMEYAAWGINEVMSKKQRLNWGIYCAYQVRHLWKGEYPAEYAIWNKWASGENRSEAAASAARATAWAATWAAREAASVASAARAAREAASVASAAKAAAWAATWAAEADWAAGDAREAASVASAAREAAWAATWAAEADWAAGDAAGGKMLAKLLRHGVKILKGRGI